MLSSIWSNVEMFYSQNQVLFWILSIVIPALASYSYGRYKKKNNADIFYYVTHNRIIENTKNICNDLNIKYKNKYIENFSSTTFVIINSSNTIKENDVCKKDLFGFQIKNGKFLDAQIIEKNENISDLSLKKQNNKIQINFHHINKKGVIVIQLYHTALNLNDIEFKYQIAGINKVKRLYPVIRNKWFIRNIFNWLILDFCLLIVLYFGGYKDMINLYNPLVVTIIILTGELIYGTGILWKVRFWAKYVEKYVKRI